MYKRQNLNFEYAPVKLPDAKIIITNSKVKHSLVGSAYNDRRNECETALKDLQKVTDIQTLGDLTEEEFEAHKDAIQDPVCRVRAKHAVYENQRTIKAVNALKENNIEEFGRLMNASHVSLRDDYEVSCEEIDILVDLSLIHISLSGNFKETVQAPQVQRILRKCDDENIKRIFGKTDK